MKPPPDNPFHRPPGTYQPIVVPDLTRMHPSQRFQLMFRQTVHQVLDPLDDTKQTADPPPTGENRDLES